MSSLRKPYQPPKQSLIGQVVDVIVVVALVFGALWAPAVFGLIQPGTVTAQMANPTWEKLGQTPAAQHAWEALGMKVQDAAPIILTRYDYHIAIVPFVVTMALIVGYFVFVIIYSQHEYRDVIAERFGDAGERTHR